MKKELSFIILLGISFSIHAQEQVAIGGARDESLRLEVARSIDRGLEWLARNQKDEGWWSTEDHPALTALALRGFYGSGSEFQRKKYGEKLEEGFEFLIRHSHEDGSIYNKKELQNYNTAVSLSAFMAAEDPRYRAVAIRARNYLVSQQWDFGEKGKMDHPMDGGVGYGSYPHSDMSNTMMALEAMYLSRNLVPKDSEMFQDLNWEAAIHFVQNCQNLPETNRGEWVSGDKANRGGFVYYPANSKAGEMKLEDGRVALRSYGSISYAGMMSFIYADMDRDDPRLKAALQWLSENYTLEENPGMGAQGLYYYYHTMGKALDMYGIDQLKTEDQGSVDWRKNLALKLIQLQKPDGSWMNENSRWWENDPVLATSYTIQALQRVHAGL